MNIARGETGSLPFVPYVQKGGCFFMAGKKGKKATKDSLTGKQELFCKEWIIDCNGTAAAIRAGYSERTAAAIATENLRKPKIRARIDELMAEKDSRLIATQDEVLKHLTSVLRGESLAEEVVVEGVGKGCSSARSIRKGPSELDRLKAADQLAKCYGLYNREKIDIERQKLEIERERLELEKIKNGRGDGDGSETGVILLSDILPDSDEGCVDV